MNPHLTEPPDLLPSGDGTSPTRVAAAALVRSFMRGSGESLGMIRPVAPVDPAKVARWDELAAALLEAERRQREPVRLVRLPELLSTSQVLELARDEAEFAARLDRPLPRLVNEPASLGTAFHAWVAAHYQSAALIDPEDLSGSMDDSDAGLPDLIRAFRSSSYADRAPVAVEAPVSIRLGGRTVVGRIDAVFRDGARWEVIDWKTGSRGSDPMQLGIYRLAWAEANGIDPADVVGRFVYIATGEVEELDDPVSRSRLEAMLGGG